MGGGNEAGSGPNIVADPGTYAAVGGMPPAPQVVGFPVPVGDPSPAGAAAGALGFATNMGVPGDVAASTQEDLDRRERAADAAAKFPAQDADAAQQMQGVGAQAPAQMVQQMVSSITGALGGALGGIMGPLTQLPQQAMQAGQSAMQPLMSAVQQASHGAGALEAADPTRLMDSLGVDPGAGAGGGGGGIGAGGGGTTPAGYLGPPPVPGSSPPTSPASAPAKPVMATPTGGTPTTSGPTGMTGMPMMPPGAMGAGGDRAGKDKPAEKRVSAPGVPNGQPVKGRLTVPPPSSPVTKPGDGKPTVVTNRPNRRIVIVPDDEAKE